MEMVKTIGWIVWALAGISILIIMLKIIITNLHDAKAECDFIYCGIHNKKCWGCKHLIGKIHLDNIGRYVLYKCTITGAERPLPYSLKCDQFIATKRKFIRKIVEPHT